MAHHDGQFDNMLTSSKPNIAPSRQPPNIQRLVAISGKSPNAVKVERGQKLRDAHMDQLKNPPNMDNADQSLQSQANIQAFRELQHDYETGNNPNESDESDEVTYDELVGDITNDIGQDPAADEFSMFAPSEQGMADQMFSDIDNINAENPYEEETDTDPFTMDDLAEIAEPDEGSAKSDGDIEMPNDDSTIPEPPITEGIGDIGKACVDAGKKFAHKLGKAAAIGTMAVAGANAAPSDFYHETVSPDGKETTVVASKTFHNLGQNQDYQKRVWNIYQELKENAIKANKYTSRSDQILLNKAQMYANQELLTGKPYNKRK